MKKPVKSDIPFADIKAQYKCLLDMAKDGQKGVIRDAPKILLEAWDAIARGIGLPLLPSQMPGSYLDRKELLISSLERFIQWCDSAPAQCLYDASKMVSRLNQLEDSNRELESQVVNLRKKIKSQRKMKSPRMAVPVEMSLIENADCHLL